MKTETQEQPSDQLRPQAPVGITALVDLMVEIKGYIERAEENVDYEWGRGRTLEEIINDGDMPPLYFKVIDFIERSTVEVSQSGNNPKDES